MLLGRAEGASSFCFCSDTAAGCATAGVVCGTITKVLLLTVMSLLLLLLFKVLVFDGELLMSLRLVTASTLEGGDREADDDSNGGCVGVDEGDGIVAGGSTIVAAAIAGVVSPLVVGTAAADEHEFCNGDDRGGGKEEV